MRNTLLLGAAVAAALGMHSANALNGPDTLAAQIKLNVTGASAQRDNFRNRLTQDFCLAGTFDTWQATDNIASTSEDFRAYSCTLDTNANKPDVPVAIEGKSVVIYYRSEGGSVYGVGPLLAANPTFAGGVKRLNVKETDGTNYCDQWNVAGVTHNCRLQTYSLETDISNPADALANDPSQLGVSDVEPAQFINPNWPLVSPLGAAPTSTQLAGLNATAVQGNGTVFAVLVSDSGVTAGLTNLTKETLANIFSGSVTTWDKVVNPDTNAAVGGNVPIRVCRRERGSGTQVSAQRFFLDTNCGKGSRTMPDGGSGNFVDNNTNAALITCVAAPDAIGFASFQAKPAGSHFISIDGIAPNRVSAALGKYDFNTEVTIQRRSGLSGDVATLATAIVSAAQRRASQPVGNATGSSFGLPGVGGNTASIANAQLDPPTAIGNKAKNNCNLKGSSL